MNRIIIPFAILIACSCKCFPQSVSNSYFDRYYKDKRVVVIMFDGFGMSYFKNNEMNVPLMIFNANTFPSSPYFICNKDLVRCLFENSSKTQRYSRRNFRAAGLGNIKTTFR